MIGTAIVAGGGIGGLATAIGLERIGWRVTVLEQATEFAEIGAGLSIWPNGLRALDALGLGAVRDIGSRQISRGSLRLPDGTWVRRARSDDTRVLMLHRAELHAYLRSHLDEQELVPAATVESVDPGGSSVRARIAGRARTLTADLVVGADGIDSVVRAAVCPDAPGPRFDGRTVWRGIARATGATAAVEPSITLAQDRQFGLLPLPGDRIYWYLTALADEPGRSSPDEREAVRRSVADWHAPIADLLAATPADAVLHHDLASLPELPRFTAGTAALIGDAAHAHPPDLGQGASLAIEDGVVLAAQLAGSDDLATALHGYDAARRPRSRQVARAAAAQAQRTARHFTASIRLARILPAPIWRRQTGRFADWEPPALPVHDR